MEEYSRNKISRVFERESEGMVAWSKKITTYLIIGGKTERKTCEDSKMTVLRNKESIGGRRQFTPVQ